MYNVIFYIIMPLIAYIIPLIFVLKKGKGDHRFYFRKVIFPIQYLEQRLFEKISHNVRIACRVGHIFIFIFNLSFLMMFPLVLTGNNNQIGQERMMTLYPYYFFLVAIFTILGLISYLFQPTKNKVYETK